MPVTDSDRLLAAGHLITLRDGRKANVRFGFRALKMLEDEYGSLGAVFDLIVVDDKGQPKGKVFGPLFGVIAAGLSAEYTKDELDTLLDPARLGDYMSAVTAAIEEAFPASKETAGKVPKKGGKKTNGSHGASSSTSQPSALVEANASSGG